MQQRSVGQYVGVFSDEGLLLRLEDSFGSDLMRPAHWGLDGRLLGPDGSSESGQTAHAAEHAALTYKIPYILAQLAAPVCLAPNGTVATNGIVTLGTALPTTYSGGIWLRLPANAIVGGLAGLYWAVMSSTTDGQVYTNFSDPATEFIPSIPSGTLVAAVGSNAAYTQTTGTDITLVNALLPGSALGTNGSLRAHVNFDNNNSAGTKSMLLKLGGTSIRAANRTTTTTQGFFAQLFNQGVKTIQRLCVISDGTPGSTYYAIDTSVDASLSVTANVAVATDFVVCTAACFEVLL